MTPVEEYAEHGDLKRLTQHSGISFVTQQAVEVFTPLSFLSFSYSQFFSPYHMRQWDGGRKTVAGNASPI